VARVEVPVRTALRFVSGPLPVLGVWREPESVSIDFDGFTIGWVMPVQLEGELPRGPTVTLVLESDTPDAWDEGAETIQRFLSALAFHYDTRIESRPRSGGSGETSLLHPYGHVGPADTIGFHFDRAPIAMHLDPDPQARLAVAVYREGLCAASPFYGFLAFWNVLEAVHDGDGARRNAFVRRVAPTSQYNPGTVSGDVAAHLRTESRNAVAHVIRDDPTDSSIDPDRSDDRDRLAYEGRWLQDIARKAILERWPSVVELERGFD